MATVTIAITSSGNGRWRVPADCSGSITVECVGAGAIGGGAYSKTNSITVTPLQLVYINIGGVGTNDSAGGDTWFNVSAGAPAASSSPTNACLAKGSSAPVYAGSVSGGNKLSGAGNVRYSGGAGFAETTNCLSCCGQSYFYSFGGAAGPNGDGGNGYQSGRGGGGGANGGAAGTAGSGGANRLGTGGGASGTTSGTNGTNGGGGGAATTGNTPGFSNPEIIWKDGAGNTYGVGGGWGGFVSNYPAGSVISGSYGGGGTGAFGPGSGSGLIIVTYTPTVSIGTTYTEVLNEISSGNRETYRIPYGVNTITVHAIGAGGTTASNGNGPFYGGGGGAYASSAIDVSTLNDKYGGFSLIAYSFGEVWFNSLAVATPTNSNTGVYADSGYLTSPSFPTAGQASLSVGQTKFSGGIGGTGAPSSGAFYNTIQKMGGGGGAAGPSGAGKNGGNAYNISGSASGGGGGGANGGSSSAGGNATSTTAGAGGAGNGGSGGGAAATATSNAGNGTNGGGGGGGKNTSGRINGGNGGQQNIWTDSGTGNVYGPGGGGGGGVSLTATFNNYLDRAGSGGYGGGGGYADGTPNGKPLIVLVYTMVKAVPISSNMLMMFR
jgi:hypothetical protein